MKPTFKPSISDDRVPSILIEFDTPPSIKKLPEILELLMSQLGDPDLFSPRGARVAHVHMFLDFPFYSNGELIAVIRKCGFCGATVRDYT